MLFDHTLFKYIAYAVPNGRRNSVNDELEKKRKEVVVAYFRYYPGIWLDGLRKNMENPNHDSWSFGKDSNLGLPEYKAALLTTWPWHSVSTFQLCKNITCAGVKNWNSHAQICKWASLASDWIRRAETIYSSHFNCYSPHYFTFWDVMHIPLILYHNLIILIFFK